MTNSILVRDPNDEQVGVVVLPHGSIDKMVTGAKLKVPASVVRLETGVPVPPEYVGVHNPRGVWLEFEAETVLFPGDGPKWRYYTNHMGAAYLRRAMVQQDADLFRFWIAAASTSPGAVANHLMGCLTPEDYRKALANLKRALAAGNARQMGSA